MGTQHGYKKNTTRKALRISAGDSIILFLSKHIMLFASENMEKAGTWAIIKSAWNDTSLFHLGKANTANVTSKTMVTVDVRQSLLFTLAASGRPKGFHL